ncbi:MAG: O-antigen ligase family protein [Lachnospira sp.]
MLRKILIEKTYILLLIVLMGFWGALNIQQQDAGSINLVDSPLLKLVHGLIFVLVSGYLLVNYKYAHFGRMGVLLLILCLYMAVARIVILPFTANVFSYIYQPMRDITVVLLFLFAATIACKSDELRDFFSRWIILGMLIIAFFVLKNWQLQNVGGEYSVGGNAYWILFLAPIVLYSSEKWTMYVGIILVFISIFTTFKRGGILALGLGLCAYLLVKEVLIGKKISKLMYFCLSLALIVVAFVVLDNMFDNILLERFLNIKNDGGSNRDQVWATTWQMIQQSDFEHLLFGHGYNTVVTDSPLGLSAHNDFLECIYDFGLFGSLFYWMLHISFIKQIFRNIRLRNTEAAIMAFAYTFFLVLSLISHVLIYPWLAFMGMSWGMGCASERKALSI